MERIPDNGPVSTPNGANAGKPNADGFGKLTYKLIFIAIIAFLLLIPGAMVTALIHERQQLAVEAQEEVSRMWSGEQHVAGPFVMVPYLVSERDEKGRTVRSERMLTLLPESLSVGADARCQRLNRGFYDAVVYHAELRIAGDFAAPGELKTLLGENAELKPERAVVAVGIEDLRGIEERIEIEWNGRSYVTETLSGGSCCFSGVAAAIDLGPWFERRDTIPFRIDLRLKGSEGLYVAPLGNQTDVRLDSDCPTPSFKGNFLPSSREVTEDGFSAEWHVVAQNRDFGQRFSGDRASAVRAAEFGVDLLIPVTQYQQAIRSIKYAVLIVLVTFAGVLFGEVSQRKGLHALHYLLVGLALILFYALSLSISEHLGFGAAYAIAATMTTLLIASYIGCAARRRHLGFCIGGLLVLLYTYVYVLLQMENYALLAGSVGLFVILAAVMRYSLKVGADR